jgi:hypothetical protein
MSKPTDLVQGTLDLLLLRALSLEPMHGWAIAQRIRQMSNEQLRVGQSALYPALHKLEQQGWRALSENNRAHNPKATIGGRGTWRNGRRLKRLPFPSDVLQQGDDFVQLL